MTLHIDIETFSEEDLKETGVFRYAEHPSTEVMCLGWAIGDGPVNLWVPQDVPAAVFDAVRERHPTAALHYGRKPPNELAAVWRGPKRAHNAQFERVVLNGVAGRKLGLPRTEIQEWTCTVVKAAEAGIPRS